MKKKYFYISFWLVAILAFFSFLVLLDKTNYFQQKIIPTTGNHLSINFLDEFGSFELERTDGGYYSFIDNKTNKEIDQTAREVFIGDQLILGDNSLYEVVEIDEDKVYCIYKGKEEAILNEKADKAVLSSSTNLLAGQENRPIGLYSTHTAESYVPTSGKDSKPGKGDILQVAQVIGNTLEKRGIKADVSKNIHDPHDANAYQRSRRTAVQLLKNRPLAIIDVHRDGVPDPKFYAKKIDGQDATQIRLVVGRQNQNMQANLDFAKSMKAYYDEKKPGLIKGIFIAKGNYNQDLAPRSLLIEVGTHTNTLTAANNGASTFAELLPGFLGVSSSGGPTTGKLTPGQKPNAKIDRGTGSSIIWILLVLVIGVIGFLLISTGGVKQSLTKINKEFTSFLGSFKRKN